MLGDRVTGRIFYWIHHTGSYAGNSGVQRVVRALAAELVASGRDLVPVRWCAEHEAIVRAEHKWIEGLAQYGGPRLPDSVEEGVPIHLTSADRDHLSNSWLLLPEVPHVDPEAGPILVTALDYARFYGLNLAAIFYDLIPLRFPGYEEMESEHGLYARCMAATDVIVPISHYAGTTLVEWWAEQGFESARLPVVRPILLAHELPGTARTLNVDAPKVGPANFVAVGTVEPRKNQLALLKAFSNLCRRRPDLDLRLDVVGSIHPAVADAVAAESAAEPRIKLHGYRPDEFTRELIKRSRATVFVSLEEGYGLPIAESLWMAKPCLSSDFGSMIEIADGGGCLLIDARDIKAIETGLEQLADDENLCLRLANEAVTRRLKSWAEYSQEVVSALDSIPPIRRLALIEGSKGGGPAFECSLQQTELRILRLHWSAESHELLAGFHDHSERQDLAEGSVDRSWALLPYQSVESLTEVAAIIARAHELGLKVAIEVDAAVSDDSEALGVLSTADLLLFEDDRTRDIALATALKSLARTATLRQKFRTGANAHGLTAIAANRSRLTEAPGKNITWPLPAIVRNRPLLSCSITTYNRASWLAFSLPRLLELTRPWRDVVEIVVCDNASTDDTAKVIEKYKAESNFVIRRNAENVGMLGNLGATARASTGAFVWLLGDDDLLIDGAIENVIEGIATHPDVEMVYMNYSYTNFDEPDELKDVGWVIDSAKPVASGGGNRRVDRLREVAGLNENIFTAIYTCAFRRDHALRAYQQDTRGAPFSSLGTCVPSSVYALSAISDRPAWWVGDPAIVVNMNVSWLRWALLWHLERMPDLYDMAECAGVSVEQLDRYRLSHCGNASELVRKAYFEAADEVRLGFSMVRLLERCKHLGTFRQREVPLLKRVYEDAWKAGRVAADDAPPAQLFQRYGL